MRDSLTYAWLLPAGADRLYPLDRGAAPCDAAGARAPPAAGRVSRFGPPAGLLTTIVPPSASTRSASPRNPPLRAAPPRPSSLTMSSSASPACSTMTAAREACACCATLARASEHMNQTAARCDSGSARSSPRTSNAVGIGERRARSVRGAGEVCAIERRRIDRTTARARRGESHHTQKFETGVRLAATAIRFGPPPARRGRSSLLLDLHR
jgi:hypothetical protein